MEVRGDQIGAEMMNGWEWLRWGSLAAGGAVGLGVGARALYRVGLRMYDDLYARWRDVRHDRLTLERIATQNELQNVREIRADERGRYPLLYGEGGILRDPNSLRAFTLRAVLERWPALERLDAMQRTFLALQGVPAGNARRVEALQEPVARAWPSRVTLEELLGGRRPGLHSVVLGLAVDEAGQRRVISGDMTEMVHVLVSGASGFGKSTLLEAMAKQLVLGGDCDVCAVDYGVNTFGALQEHLLYPIADTPELAVLLFRELIEELHRRRGLFAEHPRVRDLDQYNEATGAGLRPVVCFVDESASLFSEKGTKRPATELAQMGRKYGLGLVFAGTDFKADTLPTEATGNCGARIALHLRPSLSRSLLDCRDAAELRERGRALVELPGVPGLVEVQCPIVRRWDDLPGGGERRTLERAPRDDGPLGEHPRVTNPHYDGRKAAQIRELHAQGLSQRSIEEIVFGYPGGDAYKQVKAVLDSATTATATTEGADSPGGEGGPVEAGSSSTDEG